MVVDISSSYYLSGFYLDPNDCYMDCIKLPWGNIKEINTIWTGLAITCFPLGCAALTVMVRKGQLLATRIFKKNDCLGIDQPLSLKQEKEEKNLPEAKTHSCYDKLCRKAYLPALSLISIGSAITFTGLFHSMLYHKIVSTNCLNLCNGN